MDSSSNSSSCRWLLAAAVSCASAGALLATDSGPLIDLLITKGILSDQEAEELRADLVKDFAAQPAGKLNLAPHIAQFRISGDFRYRTDWDHQTLKPSAPSSLGTNGGVATGTFGSTANTTDSRTRQRLRFRVNFDSQFSNDWFAGFGLQTTQSADSGNETFRDGFENMGIFLARAFVGWRPIVASDYSVTLTAGKQRNPFNFTDLLWDGDINPQGLTEALQWRPDGMTTIDVVLGQFFYAENPEWPSNTTTRGDSSARQDGWVFVNQVSWTRRTGGEDPTLFNFVRLSPGITFYNNFDKRLSGTTTFANGQPFPGNTTGLIPVSSDLLLLTFSGEYQHVFEALATQPVRVYFDSSYNLSGEDRLHQVYGVPTSFDSGTQDHLAWAVGARIGQGAVSSSSGGRFAGDWVVDVSYRHVGATSLDPNLNDSDFALSRLNMQGFKVVLGYNFWDFVTGNVTYFHATDYRDELGRNVYANAAARGLFDREEIQTILADLSVRF